MIDRLKRYLATPSLSGQEDELAGAVHQDLERLGLHPHRVANNVWCEVGDAARPRLLLNSHLDTVPPGQGWRHDPYVPAVSDDRITGLGAGDAKGCVTALIEATSRIERALDANRPLGGTIVLCLTAEEETSGHGLSDLLGVIDPPDAAIVGEPTTLVPMTAQRGLLILRCIARGQAAHPANTPPQEAQSAITMAARDIARLEGFDWGPSHPLLGKCHANVTMITGGVAANVIPDTCEFVLDVRTTPLESHAETCERVETALESTVEVRSQRLVRVETPASEPIVQAALRALPGTQPSGSPSMSDMVFLAGTPSVKLGPGDSRRSHTPNEYITVRELQDGADAYERIILEYFKAPGTAKARP